ncbi:MAG: integration host factor subunit alpha [Planctomycetota bacterium]|jgi:integration host factor subunit alpha
MTLTKEHFIAAAHRKIGYSKSKSATMIESLLEIIKNTLENGQDVLISGFGKFCVKEKTSRRGRNPQTGEDLLLGATRVVRFKCSTALKDKINGKGSSFHITNSIRKLSVDGLDFRIIAEVENQRPDRANTTYGHFPQRTLSSEPHLNSGPK